MKNKESQFGSVGETLINKNNQNDDDFQIEEEVSNQKEMNRESDNRNQNLKSCCLINPMYDIKTVNRHSGFVDLQSRKGEVERRGVITKNYKIVEGEDCHIICGEIEKREIHGCKHSISHHIHPHPPQHPPHQNQNSKSFKNKDSTLNQNNEGINY